MKLSPLPNTVVHLKTQAEYDEYMQMCEDAGWVVFTINYWTSYKDKTCVLVDSDLLYSDRDWYKSGGYTILTLPELKAKFAPKETAKKDSRCSWCKEKGQAQSYCDSYHSYKKHKPTKPDTWHQDAVVYRRGSDWITADKVCVDGKEYTTEELKAQEAKFRAVRRAQASYFPKSK